MSNSRKTDFRQYLTNPDDVQKHDYPRSKKSSCRFQPISYSPYGNRKNSSRYRDNSRDRSQSQSQRRFDNGNGNRRGTIRCHVGAVDHQIF